MVRKNRRVYCIGIGKDYIGFFRDFVSFFEGVSPSYVLTIIGRLDAVGKFFKTLENVLFGLALKPLWGK